MVGPDAAAWRLPARCAGRRPGARFQLVSQLAVIITVVRPVVRGIERIAATQVGVDEDGVAAGEDHGVEAGGRAVEPGDGRGVVDAACFIGGNPRIFGGQFRRHDRRIHDCKVLHRAVREGQFQHGLPAAACCGHTRLRFWRGLGQHGVQAFHVGAHEPIGIGHHPALHAVDTGGDHRVAPYARIGGRLPLGPAAGQRQEDPG